MAGYRPGRLRGAAGSATKRSADRSADSRSVAIGWLNASATPSRRGGSDVLAIQETWHKASDDTSAARHAGRLRHRCRSPRYRTGSGVAVVFRQSLKCLRLAMPECQMLESICILLITATGPVIIINVYRPGPANTELSTVHALSSSAEISTCTSKTLTLRMYVVLPICSRRSIWSACQLRQHTELRHDNVPVSTG